MRDRVDAVRAWMHRREEGDKPTPLPELVQTVPHVAFEVDDLAETIAGEVLIESDSPSERIWVAFIVHDGAPVEFLQLDGLD